MLFVWVRIIRMCLYGRPNGFWNKKKHGTTVCCSYMFVYCLYNIQYTYVFLCWIRLYMNLYTSFGGKCTEPWQWRDQQIYTHIRMYTSNTKSYRWHTSWIQANTNYTYILSNPNFDQLIYYIRSIQAYTCKY
jgi:hypothetical protein